MKTCALTIIFIVFCFQPFAQDKLRNGIFLHHSTGLNIWGPNGSNTTVTDEVNTYNKSKGLTDNNKMSLEEKWFGDEDNEWYIIRDFFEGKLSTEKPIDYYYENYKIIIVKSCYPSSDIIGEGAEGQDRTLKTIYNYKQHWRAIVKIMEQHPDNFFVIWTNAPRVKNKTDADKALRSKEFCNWAKNILAEGKDLEYGRFPKNVYVFDFFSKLTNDYGYLKDEYAVSLWDSHPNYKATNLVAPQLVREIFDAALAYERVSTSTGNQTVEKIRVYPNPATDRININIKDTDNHSKVVVSNMCGQTIYGQSLSSTNTSIDVSSFPKGIYFVNIENGKNKETRKIIVK
jgi:hypothetical protein